MSAETERERERERSSDVLLGKPKNKICSMRNAVEKRQSQLMISVMWKRKFLNHLLEEEEEEEEEAVLDAYAVVQLIQCFFTSLKENNCSSVTWIFRGPIILTSRIFLCSFFILSTFREHSMLVRQIFFFCSTKNTHTHIHAHTYIHTHTHTQILSLFKLWMR